MARPSYQATLTVFTRQPGSGVLNRRTYVCTHQHRDRATALRCWRVKVREWIDWSLGSTTEMVGLDYRALTADERA